jgi:integrase
VYEQAKCKKGEKASKVYDGHGLYLHVFSTGTKVWKHQFRFAGKALVMNIGEFGNDGHPMVTLTQARERHAENRRLLAAGINPLKHRGERAVADQESFESLVWAWFEHYAQDVREAMSKKTKARIVADILPALGKLTPASIDALLISQTVREIAKRTVVTAQCVFQDLNRIFSWGISHGRAAKNPTAEMRVNDLLPKHETKSQKRVELSEMPKLMSAIRGYKSEQTRSAILLLAHTGVRTNELIKAQWSEFDLDAALWTIPEDRMKKNREHQVPLSAPVLAILRELKDQNGHSRYVLRGQGPKNPHMSEGTITGALDQMGYKGQMTGHGFRGVMSTYLNETLAYPKHIIELQLAHVTGSKTENAYNKANHIEERRKMMAEYSQWLESMS